MDRTAGYWQREGAVAGSVDGLPLATSWDAPSYPPRPMRDQLEHLREELANRLSSPGESAADEGPPDGLQLLAAQLLLVTGVGAALDGMRDRPHDHGFDDAGEGPRVALTWAPAVLGPVAAIAHAAYAFAPTDRNRTATRILDIAVIGGGLLGLAGALAAARDRRAAPSLTSLALASAGALGMLLDHSAADQAAERRRLEKKAAVVERLVPRRRPKLDRIVVHV